MIMVQNRQRRPARKRKPKFNVPNLGFFKGVKKRWRKPRGTHNKKRMKFKFMGASPRVGYRNPEKVRGMHSSGRREVLINNLAELESLGEAREAQVVIRVASGVGAKKRKALEEKAKTLKLVILNMKHDGKAPAGKAQPSAK
jgi:large subunit ribosomal protein L32e